MNKAAELAKLLEKALRPAWISLLAMAVAVELRAWPLASLEQRVPWVTFYPAVMTAALFGGLFAGLMSTLASCLIVLCLWSWISPAPFILASADWLGLGVFLFNGAFISAIAESSRRARRKARLSQQQAEAASRAKTVFLANMSHELRTPLNAVLGYSRLMQGDAQPGSVQAGRLDTIIQSGEHLLNLINNILDISRIESGRISLEEAPANLHGLVREVFNLMGVQANFKGLEFTLELSGSLPVNTRIDAGKLRQVLINLLGNAIKFTPTGRVALRAAPAGNARLRVEVEDSGPGIRPGDRETAFTPFERLGNAGTASGSGLGLAICRQNIELMGGTIGIAEAPSGGALVYFEIPLTALPDDSVPAVPAGSRVTGLAPGQPARRLLIVDDDLVNRRLLWQMLDLPGFELAEAADGREGVALFESWRPDLVWMDIRMPVMDGKEAIRRIRIMPGGQQVKIIALTAHALDTERQEILAAGCDAFIRKPFSDTEIFQALSSHLGAAFTYKVMGSPQPNAGAAGSYADSLRALPGGLLNQLAEAAEKLDSQLCYEAADRIAPLDSELAGYLAGLVDRLQFPEILALVDPIIMKGEFHA